MLVCYCQCYSVLLFITTATCVHGKDLLMVFFYKILITFVAKKVTGCMCACACVRVF